MRGNLSMFVVDSLIHWKTIRMGKQTTLEKFALGKRPRTQDEEDIQQKIEDTTSDGMDSSSRKSKIQRTEQESQEKKTSVSSSPTNNVSPSSLGNETAKNNVTQDLSETSLEKLEDMLEPSWHELLKGEFKKPYWKKLKGFVASQYDKKPEKIFPPASEIFNAFNHCTYDNVKVVILGQDPYHGSGQAHGLSFSVKKGVKIPPSLTNIYKELVSDIKGFTKPSHGNLLEWADQGVLLLNTVLTVESGLANSHKNQGWERFTDAVIDVINKNKSNVVFFLWGAPSQKKGKNISEVKHCVLKSAHPSPLSASKGFFGCKHFSKCNEYLKKHGKQEIHWQIS